MSFEPSDVMVEAAVEQFSKAWGRHISVEASIRSILRAAFAAAVEAGEAREANAYTNEHSSERHWTASTDYTFCHFPALILRSKPQQEGEM